jgi:alpha-ribazole phosphatase
MTCYLIRHGITEGNNALQFNGSGTDEPLTEEGKEALKAIEGVKPGSMLFTSPMKRALETAAIMFPGIKPVIIDDLREMHFGIFEGKNHVMLDGDAEYQAWLDSGGEAAIPGGESIEIFRERAWKGFTEALGTATRKGTDTIYLVVHGGTIMAVMSSLTGEDYFAFNAPNGAGYIIEVEIDDAGNVTASTTYDRFCGGLRAGSDGWRPPRYTPSDSMDR